MGGAVSHMFTVKWYLGMKYLKAHSFMCVAFGLGTFKKFGFCGVCLYCYVVSPWFLQHGTFKIDRFLFFPALLRYD